MYKYILLCDKLRLFVLFLFVKNSKKRWLSLICVELGQTIDKHIKIVNNIDVGREPLNLSKLKDSASHPTV